MKATILVLVILILFGQCQNVNQLNTLNNCQQSILSQLANFKKSINGQPNVIIDAIANFAKNIKNIFEQCSLTNYAEEFDRLSSSVCIDGLDKGAKLIVKMIGEQDNQAKFTFDFLLLQKLYQNKIKKQCQFLNLNTFDLKSGGVCLESAYKLSLILQSLWQHLGQGNLKAALADFDGFITLLPDTLDNCGQSSWATQVRKYFPVQCLYSINDLAKQLSLFEHNYDHLEWLVKHRKQLSKVFSEVRKTCPLFA